MLIAYILGVFISFFAD